jgi:acetyl-CoA carboxylase carboxyltransferase component
MVEPRSPEGWDGVLGDMERRRQASRAMGGEERLRKHREAGKLDARSRIGHLLDPGRSRSSGRSSAARRRRPTPS